MEQIWRLDILEFFFFCSSHYFGLFMLKLFLNFQDVLLYSCFSLQHILNEMVALCLLHFSFYTWLVVATFMYFRLLKFA